MANDGDPVKSALATFTAAAKAIGLSGTKLEEYVHQHMSKAGFRAKVTRSYTQGSTKSSGSGGFLSGLFGSEDSEDEDDE